MNCRGIGPVSLPSRIVFRKFEGWGRFDNDEIIGFEDFNTFGPFLSNFHPDSVVHSFASSHTVFISFPRIFPSVFCLTGTCCVYLFSLSLSSLLIIDLSWHFSFPWSSPFFILLEINYYLPVKIKIRHYRTLYLNHQDHIVFIPLTVDTTGHLYDDFIRLGLPSRCLVSFVRVAPHRF